MQQRLTPNELLGRVNISARVFTRGVIMVGALTWGAIAAAVGVTWSFVLGGMIEAIAALFMWHVLRDLPTETAEL